MYGDMTPPRPLDNNIQPPMQQINHNTMQQPIEQHPPIQHPPMDQIPQQK